MCLQIFHDTCLFRFFNLTSVVIIFQKPSLILCCEILFWDFLFSPKTLNQIYYIKKTPLKLFSGGNLFFKIFRLKSASNLQFVISLRCYCRHKSARIIRSDHNIRQIGNVIPVHISRSIACCK